MQGGASWREPRLVAKLARILQNDDFSDFELLQCEIPKFVWALTWGKRYFIRFPVGWWKPQAQIKQRAGDFNSLRLPHEAPDGENLKYHENQGFQVALAFRASFPSPGSLRQGAMSKYMIDS